MKVVDIHKRITDLEGENSRLKFTILEVIRMIHFDGGYNLKDTWWHPSGTTMMDILIQSTGMSQEEVIKEVADHSHVNRLIRKKKK